MFKKILAVFAKVYYISLPVMVVFYTVAYLWLSYTGDHDTAAKVLPFYIVWVILGLEQKIENALEKNNKGD